MSVAAPLREIVVDTPYGRLTGLRGGQGTPVLALHGWLDNAASFVPLASHLRGIDLVALDLPGHGTSQHLPPGAEYALANTVQTLLDAADALGWARFAVLGHSMGGAIGTILAAAAPERVARFFAIEALGALADREDRTAQRLRESIAAGRALRGKSLRVFPDRDTAIRARMQANALSEPAARLLVERGTRAVAGGFTWSSDPRLTVSTAVRMTEGQVVDLIASIACDVRVLFADPAPPYFTDALRKTRTAALAHGEVIVRKGTHHLHMEDPQGTADVIGDFLADALTAPAPTAG